MPCQPCLQCSSMLMYCALDMMPKPSMHAGQAAYLVTFGRAGEDNKSFKLGDVDQTLAGSGRACVQMLT